MEKKVVATNPTAKHNYSIEKTLEAGIVLTGTEIKSIRNGKINMKDSYAIIKNGEVLVYGMHISPYEHGNIYDKREDIAKKDAEMRIKKEFGKKI